MELVPVPQEVPLTVIEPELLVMLAPCALMPKESNALAAVPVIVTLPVPLAEMLDVIARMPADKSVALAALPVIVTLPVPLAEMLASSRPTPME